MTPGQLARTILGPLFPAVGDAYRRIFVDMDKVVDYIVTKIPRNANVLDIGGGDGYVVNMILGRRSDIHITMTDIAPAIGSFIQPHNLSRATLFPGTTVDDVEGQFDFIMLTDVLHHIPLNYRKTFLASLGARALKAGCGTIVVKDVQPGSFRARLSLWSDLYVTGDKTVALIAAEDIDIPGFVPEECVMPDDPNYCLVLRPDEHQATGDE